ncbi:MAG: glycosyltransferase [Paludibacter sp.]|nr:glycosyltransferase [Paludibacter sp.]
MIIESEEFIQEPLVSVVIITYNQENTIAQTIESILSQHCDFPFEIIIGDDFGADKTRLICKEYQQKYPEKIKLVLLESNVGVVHNWLNCIKMASGKYITTCAGDDFWHNPEKLQLQVDYMEKVPECGVLHTDYDELDTKTNKTIPSCRRLRKEVILEGFKQKEIFNGKLKIVAPTACIRKELFDKYIPIADYIRLKFTIEDWPTWVILSKYSTINYLPVSTATYRKGHESLSNLKSYDKIILRFEKEKIMYKYLCDLFSGELKYNENDYDIFVHGVLLSLAYKKCDFTSANKYGKILLDLGSKSTKIKSAKLKLSFYIYYSGLRLKSFLH